MTSDKASLLGDILFYIIEYPSALGTIEQFIVGFYLNK